MKKLILLLFACSIPLYAAAQTFLDARGHLHEVYIETLAQNNIVEGYGYGIFRPDISINRAEFLKILMLAVFGKEVYSGAGECFTDFTGQVQWYWVHACIAKQRGIIQGYPDGSFQGEKTVNLAEALKIAIEAWGIEVPPYVNTPEYWYLPYFSIAGERGLFDYFPRRGEHLLTRSEMAYLIVKLGEPLADGAVVAEIQNPKFQIPNPDPNPNPNSNPSICGNGSVEPGEQCDDGNLTDGDGCSSICVIVEQPVRHAALRIDERPTAVPSASAGSESVPLFTFEALVGRQDATLTTLKFAVRQGSTTDATNYKLFLDIDSDGTFDVPYSTATAQNGIVTFAPLEIPLQDGVPFNMQVRADLLTSAEASNFQLGFAETDPRFVTAVGQVDGRDLTGIEINGADCTESSICWIAVNTLSTQPALPVVERGNLYVTMSSSPVRSHQLLAGALSDDLLALTLRAEGEAIQVEEMMFSGLPNSIDELYIFPEGAASALSIARETQCSSPATGRLCASTALEIARGDERRFTLRAKVKPDTAGGVSGQTVQLGVSTLTMAIEAVGVGSQANLTDNDGDTEAEGEIFIGTNTAGPNQTILGSVHDTAFAKITSITNSNPDPDSTAVPVGAHPIGQFRFTAAQHSNSNNGLNPVEIDKLQFALTASNVQIFPGTVQLYNTLDSSVTVTCTADASTGAINVICSNLRTSSVSTVIEQGRSIDLALRVTVLQPKISDSAATLQLSLQQLGDRSNPGSVTWTDGETNFGWVDIDESTVSSTAYRS